MLGMHSPALTTTSTKHPSPMTGTMGLEGWINLGGISHSAKADLGKISAGSHLKALEPAELPTPCRGVDKDRERRLRKRGSPPKGP